MRLGHAAFGVADVRAALRFYVDGLGLRESFRITCRDLARLYRESEQDGGPRATDRENWAFVAHNPDAPWIVYLEVAPLQFLELFPAMGASPSPDRRAVDPHAHICLEVDDIQSFWTRVTAAGIVSDGEPRLGGDGSLQFWITDPDGHRIEVMQYTASSLQLRAVSQRS